jgi:DNA-3-methyladenine glycosylase II
VTRPAFDIKPSGPFSLAEIAGFGFGQRAAQPFDGVLRLAFCLDGYREQVGVEVRQDESGVHGIITAGPGTQVEPVRRQVARALSLDHDGAAFRRVGERDPVIGALQQVAPGLRPPLFYSPYEAAAWAVLSARRPARQMAEARARLSTAHGRVFQLAGQPVTALPTPEQLLAVHEFARIPAEKMERLHGVARAALDGQLDADRIRALGEQEALASLQRIRGIGPFYSMLILIRASGLADVLPVSEPNLLATVARLYRLPAPPGPDQLTVLAEPWRPFRTWAAVLIRAAADRLPAAPSGRVS